MAAQAKRKFDIQMDVYYSLNMSDLCIYTIKHVSLQTGLTPHLIRAWENRYGVIKPARTKTNRRVYSENDIEKLHLLNAAVKAGNSIGQIAALTKGELQKLAVDSNNPSASLRKEKPHSTNGISPVNHYEVCVRAAAQFDVRALENALSRAAIELNQITLLEGVVIPFIRKIGELWSEGVLKVYHEHMASSVLRTFLGDMLRFSDAQPDAPSAVVATPAGQHHELGALIVAVAAATAGWRVTYLGANLPPEEIAGAAAHSEAKVICLSLVFPADDPKLPFEIKKLRRYLPQQTAIISGGQAADRYKKHLEESGAMIIQSIADLLKTLKSLR
jgi:methylmalonyl-CoA mutase cobalamin-binding domain/chain